MKLILQALLILLFLLQGTKDLSVVTLLVSIAALGTTLLIHRFQFAMPKFVLIMLAGYCFFLAIGLSYGHELAQIDIKYQIYGFIFFIILMNLPQMNVLRLLFVINFIVAFIYILLRAKMFPSFWMDNHYGVMGKVFGPANSTFSLIAFYYLLHGRKGDWKFTLAFLVSLICLFSTSSFLNIVLSGILFSLVWVDVKKLFKPVIIIPSLVLALAAGALLQSDKVPPMIQAKAQYITHPWDYDSFKIRIVDLKQALKNEAFEPVEVLFGQGFGATSEIYRENYLDPRFSGFFHFQEIDNGFYYLYHRGGLVLLGIFLFTHVLLFMKIPGLNSRIAFVFTMILLNFMSIHYFTYMFYLLIPFWILTSKESIKLKWDWSHEDKKQVSAL